jgi:ribosomal protein S18 acetylase RimI-like enzyme
MPSMSILKSSSPVQIRTAARADIPAMAAVINAAFAIETFLEGTRTDEAGISELMQKGVFLVAESETGGIVASVYTEVHGPSGYFGMLAVAPSHQGLHLGQAMIAAAEDYCRTRGCTGMDITVLSLRAELPAYYRKLGYVETGTEEFRPSRPLKTGVECHCIVMSKML